MTARRWSTGRETSPQYAPGHDAWIIGDEPCVFLDWQGFSDYAKR